MWWRSVVYVFVFAASRCFSNEEDIHAEHFCKYLQSTPEPDVLIYNRVPKCGSKTLVELLKERHRIKPTGVAMFSTGGRHWNPINYDSNITHREILKTQASKIQDKKKKLLLAGHWNWHNFRGDFDNRTVEHINVVRVCDSRIRSQLFFDLFDEKNAKAASKGGYLDTFQSKLLQTNMTLQNCLDDRACIAAAVNRRDSQLTGITHAMVHYLCGEKCVAANSGDILKGAIANLNPTDVHGRDVGGAVAVGINEDLAGTLRMFACAYPTYFRTVAKMLQRSRRFHKPSAQSATLRSHTNLDVIGYVCRNSGDNELYEAAKRFMLAKLKRISADRESCCRKSKTKGSMNSEQDI